MATNYTSIDHLVSEKEIITHWHRMSIIAPLVFLFITGIISYAFLQNSSLSSVSKATLNKNSIIYPTADMRLSPTPTVNLADTDKWEEYSNEKLGISFRYPNNAELIDYTRGDNIHVTDNPIPLYANTYFTYNYVSGLEKPLFSEAEYQSLVKAAAGEEVDLSLGSYDEDADVSFKKIGNTLINDISAVHLSIEVKRNSTNVKGINESSVLGAPLPPPPEYTYTEMILFKKYNRILNVSGQAVDKTKREIVSDIFRKIAKTAKFSESDYYITIPSDWNSYTNVINTNGRKVSMALPPGFTFTSNGKASFISNADGSEKWEYKHAEVGGVGGPDRPIDEWYEEYLNRKVEVVKSSNYRLDFDDSYTEVVIKEGSSQRAGSHFLKSIYAMNILQPMNDVARSDNSVIKTNIREIIYSLKEL